MPLIIEFAALQWLHIGQKLPGVYAMQLTDEDEQAEFGDGEIDDDVM